MNLTNLNKILRNKLMSSKAELNYLEEMINFYEKIRQDFEEGKVNKNGALYLQRKYQMDVTKYNLGQALGIIFSGLFVVKTQKEKQQEQIDKIKFILNCLKYKQVISVPLMDYLRTILAEENIENVDLINIMEQIKIHNAKCVVKDKKMQSKDLFLIINMVNQGFEDIKLKDNANKEKLEMVAKKTINLIDSIRLDEVKNMINLDSIYSSKDLKYLYSLILRYYQEKIIDLIEILKQEEFYFDIAILQEIKEEYKVLYQKYMLVRNMLDGIVKNDYDEEMDAEEDLEEIKDNKEIKLYYASNSDEATKCYFVKDLENIREEALAHTLILLEDFKMGKMNKFKNLANLKSFGELKDDQIRIVLKILDNNCYAVMGVFIKKSDNDRVQYVNMTKRPILNNDDNYSLEVENYYKDYILQNQRKGSR